MDTNKNKNKLETDTYQFFGDQRAQLLQIAREERRAVRRGPLRLFMVYLGLFILGILLPIVLIGVLG